MADLPTLLIGRIVPDDQQMVEHIEGVSVGLDTESAAGIQDSDTQEAVIVQALDGGRLHRTVGSGQFDIGASEIQLEN